MKQYKFSQLNAKAKVIAVFDYYRGIIDNRDWHDDVEDCLSFEECFDLCADTENDVVYNEKGELIEEEVTHETI